MPCTTTTTYRLPNVTAATTVSTTAFHNPTPPQLQRDGPHHFHRHLFRRVQAAHATRCGDTSTQPNMTVAMSY
jgi:hypothetical protein